jgi:hypothetical protein
MYSRTNFVAGKGFILTKPLPTSEKFSREKGAKSAKSAKRSETLQIVSREKGLVQKERPKTLTKKLVLKRKVAGRFFLFCTFILFKRISSYICNALAFPPPTPPHHPAPRPPPPIYTAMVE